MQDKTLTCRDCGHEFIFSVGEQQFYAEKGFTNEPGRCPECRAARRAARGRSGSRRERQMHPAVCAQCGRATEVPFEPRTDRPVYCPECYWARRSGRRKGRWNPGRSREDDRR